MCDLLTCNFILGTKGEDVETKSNQKKLQWSNAMTDDRIDIICYDERKKKNNFQK